MARSEHSDSPIGDKQQSILISRLASKLQLAIKTGVSSTKVMKKVDEFIIRNLNRKIEGIVGKLDSLLNTHAQTIFGERIGLLYLQVASIQEKLNECEEGYRNLCSSRGRVKPSSLKELLSIDDEIAYHTYALYDLVSRRRASIRKALREAEEIVEEIGILLDERRELINTANSLD